MTTTIMTARTGIGKVLRIYSGLTWDKIKKESLYCKNRNKGVTVYGKSQRDIFK